jgi:RimJ/RimL family protein N-acetyltransferase
MGFEKGETGLPAPPFGFLQEPAMTFAPEIVAHIRQGVRVPVLETARLKLRAPRREDAKAIGSLASEFRVAANTARIPHPYRVTDAEEFIAAANSREGEACFVVIRDGRLIGACGIDPREEGPELGYWLGVPFWGRGYATEAARAVVDYAFGDLGSETLLSGARVTNPASRRVLEKCAFQWTGVRLTRIRSINSAAPVDRFRLDRGLWASLKSWGQVRSVA